MILVIDHYDSFTYLICDYLAQIGYTYKIVTTDNITLEILTKHQPSHLVLGPGPGHPNDHSLALVNPLISAAIKINLPILGICLGHQILGAYFGHKIIGAKFIVHGKQSLISHSQQGIFANIPSPLRVTRYNSLLIDNSPNHSSQLKITALSENNEIMAIEHKSLNIHGIQFHPESILTESGKDILINFCGLKK
jgi:anthranilate synthase/aminodeoxychorismate synthase-like glutamine amidotransferase